MANRGGRAVPKACGREYLVRDRVALANAISRAIDRRYGGNRSAAARAAGVPHSTLKRFQDQAGGAVREQTLEKLRDVIGPNRRKQLEAALFSPEARDSLANYNAWVEKETLAISFGTVVTSVFYQEADKKQRKSLKAFGTERGEGLRKLIAALKIAFPAAWKPLGSVVLERNHSKERVQLAELRVVASMLDYVETWGVERVAIEMSHSEQKRFIRCGAIREAIILNRETDIRRAQETPVRYVAHSDA